MSTVEVTIRGYSWPVHVLSVLLGFPDSSSTDWVINIGPHYNPGTETYLDYVVLFFPSPNHHQLF